MAGSPLIADFDFTNLIISIKASGSYNAENDLYSDWKEQVIEDATGFAAQKPPAFLNSVGGDDLGAGQQIAPYFFINNVDGWRLRPPEEDGETSVVGNLFPADPNTQFIIPTVGPFTQLLRLVVSPQAIVDTSGGTLTVAQDRLLQDIHGQTQRRVYIDTENSPGGQYGYQQDPFNNFTDAVDYMEANGLQIMGLETDATVDRQLRNFEIDGIGRLPQLDLNGQVMDGCTVRNCAITGTQGVNGGPGQLIAFECQFTNVTDFEGAGSLIGGIGTISFRNGTSSILNELLPFVAGQAVTLSLTPSTSPDGPVTLGIQNASGSFIITDMDNAGDQIHITMKQGTVTIDSSCTAGSVVIAGETQIIDNSGPACAVLHTAVVQPEDIHFIKNLVGGDAVVSLDDQTVTIYDIEQSPRQVLAVYNISPDGRIRTRTA
jgi:hypothetical protein